MKTEIYTSDPVDRLANTVTGQSGCRDSVLMSEKYEIVFIVNRLQKQIHKIKVDLGVRNRGHWKNLKQRMNLKKNPAVKSRKLFFEALRIGEQINQLNKTISR